MFWEVVWKFWLSERCMSPDFRYWEIISKQSSTGFEQKSASLTKAKLSRKRIPETSK